MAFGAALEIVAAVARGAHHSFQSAAAPGIVERQSSGQNLSCRARRQSRRRQKSPARWPHARRSFPHLHAQRDQFGVSHFLGLELSRCARRGARRQQRRHFVARIRAHSTQISFARRAFVGNATGRLGRYSRRNRKPFRAKTSAKTRAPRLDGGLHRAHRRRNRRALFRHKDGNASLGSALKDNNFSTRNDNNFACQFGKKFLNKHNALNTSERVVLVGSRAGNNSDFVYIVLSNNVKSRASSTGVVLFRLRYKPVACSSWLSQFWMVFIFSSSPECS